MYPMNIQAAGTDKFRSDFLKEYISGRSDYMDPSGNLQKEDANPSSQKSFK